MGGTDVELSVLQSIASIREDSKAHREKRLVEEMVELDADRDNNADEAEVEVDVSAVYKDLITLNAIHLDSDVGNYRGKVKPRVSASIDELLTKLRIQTLST